MTEIITEDPLLKLFDISRMAALEDIAKNGDTMPTFFAETNRTENGKPVLMVIVTPWGDATDRLLMLSTLKLKMHQDGVVRYAFAATVWGAHYTPADMDGERPKVMPMDRPDRKEFLTILGVEPGRPVLREKREVFRVSETEATVGEPIQEADAPLGIVEGGAILSLLGPITQRKEAN